MKTVISTIEFCSHSCTLDEHKEEAKEIKTIAKRSRFCEDSAKAARKQVTNKSNRLDNGKSEKWMKRDAERSASVGPAVMEPIQRTKYIHLNICCCWAWSSVREPRRPGGKDEPRRRRNNFTWTQSTRNNKVYKLWMVCVACADPPICGRPTKLTISN